MALDVNAAMDTLGAALGTITGLRVFDFAADNVYPPAAIIPLPDTVEYDATHQRGTDRASFKVYVLVGKASDRNARDALAGYMSGTAGAGTSVKAAIDAIGPAVRVERSTTMTMTIGGAEYLAAEFDVDYVT